MNAFSEIDYQKQLIVSGLDDFSPNAALSHVLGGQFGPRPELWKQAVVDFLCINVRAGMLECVHRKDIKQIDNAFGALQSGGLMSLTTAGNVDLTSAKVKAGSLNVDAGGNLILDTATKTDKRVSRDGATSVVTTLGPTAQVDVVGDAAIKTGGDFQQNAGNLTVGGNLGAGIGGNWTLGTQQTGEHKIVQRANGVSDMDFNSVVGSTVKVGGVSSIGVGGDFTAKGAQIVYTAGSVARRPSRRRTSECGTGSASTATTGRAATGGDGARPFRSFGSAAH
nr:hypothetical protein [Burkholderia stagnalis]